MSLFLKDPKTCADPWHGLLIIVFVCGFVLVALFVGKARHHASYNQLKTSGSRIVAPAGNNQLHTAVTDNRLRF